MQKLILPLVLLLSALLLGACKDNNKPKPAEPIPLSGEQQSQLVTNYANILAAGYQDAYEAALVMQTKINAFIDKPAAQSLEDAKKAWLDAREPYMQTEVARFYGGPIEGDEGDALLNSWPLDEGYIDYLAGDRHGHSSFPAKDFTTGIINMRTEFPDINQEVLTKNNQPNGGTKNGHGDEVYVSVGYHAIEFLLWGQDNTPAGDKIPGRRSYKDYLTTAEATAPNGKRRGDYLRVITQLAVDNLKAIADAWAPNANNYRKTFEASKASSAIDSMFNGVGRLAKGEMSGERMGVPLNLKIQEQEHSCFSDNTHRDLWLNMQGIVNVYYGTYTRTNGAKISGLGLSDYVKGLNPKADDNMKELLTKAQASLKAIEDNKPFDWLIDGNNPSGNKIVEKGVKDVGAVADWVSQIARDLKLKVKIPDENP